MDFAECIKFANDNPACAIATVDGDQPRVRMFAMWYADETGFYFHSGSMKAVCRQLKANPKVEICFYAPAPPPDAGKTMRVAGKVEFLEDTALRARLLEERPFLRAMGVQGPDDPMLAVFRVYTGNAHFWTMDSNMRESESERVEF